MTDTGSAALRTLGDRELLALAARLERACDQLRDACQETGLLIRLKYTEALTAARVELERRAI